MRWLWLVLVWSLCTGVAWGEERMVALKAEEVNVRAGPGLQYPKVWVFKRRHMPVLVIQEWEGWRKIRDWEGQEGWINQVMLTRRPSVLVIAPEVGLRMYASDRAPLVARLQHGIAARILKCFGVWCHLDVRGHRGWAHREGLWGGLQP